MQDTFGRQIGLVRLKKTCFGTSSDKFWVLFETRSLFVPVMTPGHNQLQLICKIGRNFAHSRRLMCADMRRGGESRQKELSELLKMPMQCFRVTLAAHVASLARRLLTISDGPSPQRRVPLYATYRQPFLFKHSSQAPLCFTLMFFSLATSSNSYRVRVISISFTSFSSRSYRLFTILSYSDHNTSTPLLSSNWGVKASTEYNPRTNLTIIKLRGEV